MKNHNPRIRPATMADLATLLPIYDQARRYMVAMGNPTQWGYYYPNAEVTEADIARGVCYVVEDVASGILGVFVWESGPYAPYDTIYHGRWLNDAPYGVLLRLASAGRGGGLADVVLRWVIAQGGDVRVDTHRDNLSMRQALLRHGFRLCGSVRLEDGASRIAFQWCQSNRPPLTAEEQAERATQALAYLSKKQRQVSPASSHSQAETLAPKAAPHGPDQKHDASTAPVPASPMRVYRAVRRKSDA